jgi:8-oxo-dGTP pyrophosphatase MutT (NUDIX family)
LTLAQQWRPFVARLEETLGRPLPGPDAQWRLAPRPQGHAPGRPPQPAGVLILLYPHCGTLHLPLTRRTQTVATHRGQISWPGGAREGEEPLARTALRETEEELGVDPTSVEVLGQLTPLHTGSSGFLITPVVGWTRARPSFRPDPREVAAVLEVPLAALRAPEVLRQETWDLHGQQTLVPFYRLGPEITIWGATAMILSEFLTVLEDAD